MNFFSRLLLVLLALQTISFQSYAMCPKGDENPFEFQGKKLSANATDHFSDDLLQTPKVDVINVENLDSQSWDAFMGKVVKPKSDDRAINGFTVLAGKDLIEAVKVLDTKVGGAFLAGANRDDVIARIVKIADALNKEGPMNFLVMEDKIKEIDAHAPNLFKLPLMFALLSNGGVVVRLAEGNYAVNVNYPVEKGNDASKGQLDVGVQGGRTYIFAPLLKGKDVSDKDLINLVDDLAVNDPDQMMLVLEGYNNFLIDATDNSIYKKLDKKGQTVLTALKGVAMAEGIRNKMDGSMNTNDWDRTVRRKAVYGAFRAGLVEAGITETFIPYKKRIFGVTNVIYTTQTYAPYASSIVENKFGGRTSTYELKKTSLYGLWDRGDTWKSHTEKGREHAGQPLSNDDLQTRSGLGVTNDASEVVEIAWTDFIRSKNAELVNKIAGMLKSEGKNLVDEADRFFYGDHTPGRFDEKFKKEFDALWDEFEADIRKFAKDIHKGLLKSNPQPELPGTVEVWSDGDGMRINEKGQLLDKYGKVMMDGGKPKYSKYAK